MTGMEDRTYYREVEELQEAGHKLARSEISGKNYTNFTVGSQTMMTAHLCERLEALIGVMELMSEDLRVIASEARKR